MNKQDEQTEISTRAADDGTWRRSHSGSNVSRSPTEGESLGEPPDRLGRYVLERSLGQGAMGSVYLARDTTLERHVAIKIPRFERASTSPERIARFYREARTMAAISHRNLCTIYDVSQIEGFHCLTMEYLRGEPLSDVLNREQRLDGLHAVKLIRSLCEGLQLAHDAGVVHRDIKPANIIIDESGEPVLTDFGIARRVEQSGSQTLNCQDQPDSSESDSSHDDDSMTCAGNILGTPAYMAPEQADPARTEQVGPRSDVYSLGVLLYRMLCGQTPFKGRMSRVIRALLNDHPAPPSKHCPDINPRLEGIILRALEKQPDDRFESASALGIELGDYIASLDQAARRRNRNRILTVAVPTLIVGAVLALSMQKPEPTPASNAPETPFVDSAQLFEASHQNAAAFVDIDGDGDLDLVTVGSHQEAGHIWLNDGQGRMKESPERFVSGTHAAFGDLDGDDDPDALVVGEPQEGVYLNDGTGRFLKSRQTLSLGKCRHVSLGDVDGDGDFDAFLGSGGSSPMHNRVLFNNGDGQFSDSGQQLGDALTVVTTLADIDGDNDLDAVTANSNGDQDAIWLNNGSGRFTLSDQEFEPVSSKSLAAADLDSDGDLDLVFAVRNSGLMVWLNDGSGQFVNSAQSFSPGSISALHILDANADGEPDVVTATSNLSPSERHVEAPHSIWWNNGRGHFSSSWQYGGLATTSVIGGDVDGDGDPDLFELGADDVGSHLLLNQYVPSRPIFEPGGAGELPSIEFEFP